MADSTDMTQAPAAPVTAAELLHRLAKLEAAQDEMRAAANQLEAALSAMRKWEPEGVYGQELATLRELLGSMTDDLKTMSTVSAAAVDTVQAQQDAETEPAAAPAAAPEEPADPTKKDLPLTRGLSQLLDQVETMKGLMRQLEESDTLPDTDVEMDEEFRKEALGHWDTLLTEFGQMHRRNRTEAERKFMDHVTANLPLKNPMNFWNGEALRQYSEFRTRLLVEKFFDPLELRVNQLREDAYRELLDDLASTFDLEQMHVEVGRTRFDAELHECVDLNSEKETGDKVRVINRVLLSGYLDRSDGLVLRKAFVKTRMNAKEAQDLRQKLTPSKPKPGAMLDTDAKGMTVSDLGEVMVPRQVVSVKNRVTRMNGALKKVLGTDLPNELGSSVNYEVRSSTMDLVARFYKQFSQFHERSKALAFLNYKRMRAENPDEELTPSAGWDDQMVFEYKEFRERRLMEDCLDRLEEKINQLGAMDHLVVLDLLAQEMEVGRMAIIQGVTVYDPERHAVDSRMVTGGVKLEGRPIARLLQSGYVDLTGGAVLRKATVRVQI